MKAWKAYEKDNTESGSTIVFAESASKAKVIAKSTDACKDAQYIDIRVERMKKADDLYKGNSEMNWYDDDTRLRLVRDFGWRCYEPSWECDNCIAKEYCYWHKEDT